VTSVISAPPNAALNVACFNELAVRTCVHWTLIGLEKRYCLKTSDLVTNSTTILTSCLRHVVGLIILFVVYKSLIIL